MTWYRVAMASGREETPIVAFPGYYGEQLPESLQWTWSADNGDLVTRIGNGTFRMSSGDIRSNWFQEIDCRMVAWPGGDMQAKMTCEDGVERTMLIPGDGIVVVDDVQYARVFLTEPVPFEDGGEPLSFEGEVYQDPNN